MSDNQINCRLKVFYVPLRRILFVAIFCLAGAVPARSSDDAELADYFAGLRSQGLFLVAEEYAVSRLAEPEVSPVQRAILSVELSKLLAAHAAEATSETEAAELWNRADEVILPLVNETANPRWCAVRSRQASLLCDRALADFWQCRLDPDSEAKRSAALTQTAAALKLLQTVLADIRDAMKAPLQGTGSGERHLASDPGGGRKPESGMTSVEVRRIVDELEFLLLRLTLNQGQLMPAGPDRVAMFVDADQFSAAQVKHVNSEFIWPVRLARAEAMRWLGDPDRAIAYVKSLRSADLDVDVADALAAEQARSILVSKKPADALQYIVEYSQSKSAPSQGQLSSELRAILVECLLASIPVTRGKGDQSIEEDLWTQMIAQQQLTTGPWRTYVDGLLARSNETRQYGDQLAALVREGRLASQRREWSMAVNAYGRAAELAHSEGKEALAAEFTFTQASLEIEAGQFEQASVLLRDYPTRFPQDPRLVEAHLLSAWTLGKLNAARPNEARRAEYLAQLRDHVTRFPDSPTIYEAQWSLAIDAIQHLEWEPAVDALEEIPAGHARALEAQAQLPYCYEQGLAARPVEASKPDWEERAIHSFQKQLAGWPRSPLGWSLVQSENALRWARLLLRMRSRRFVEADRLLVQILNSREIEIREVDRDGSKLDPAWDRLLLAATQLRIISLAGLGRVSEAEKLFESSTETSVDELLVILSGLSELATSLDEVSREQLGRVQLAAARRLQQQRAALAPELAGLVDRCLADAYVATGDLPEAIELYESLLQSHSRDRTLLETIGTLSLKRGQREDLERAKKIYRRLEGLDPAGSPAWVRSRLTVARVCFLLGEKAECAKLLKVTRILYPDLAGAALKAEYSALEMQLMSNP